MLLEQRPELSQRLMLTQSMQQSLQCLQMSSLELKEYLREATLSNPFLNLEDAPLGDVALQALEPPERPGLTLEQRDRVFYERGRRDSEGGGDLEAFATGDQSFQDYLNEQLGQTEGLSPDMLALCRYVVGCLNSAGYLDCPLRELAGELGAPLFDMEQALYAVQSLDPPGVGARTLSECLLLQLVQGGQFTELNLHMIRYGLPLLAERDYDGLSKLLNAPRADVERAAETVRALNPIPSRGFPSGADTGFVVPDAAIRREGDSLSIEMNDRLLTGLTLDGDYCALIGSADCPDAQPYLKEKLSEARSLISSVQGRQNTLLALLAETAAIQRDYFLRRGELVPMTMGQLAERLDVNISTVSRTVKDKYIQFEGHTFPLRELFAAPLPSGASAASARRTLRRLVEAENSAAPLSDDALREAMQALGVSISRRTVAKYRSEEGIPPARERKNAGNTAKTC